MRIQADLLAAHALGVRNLFVTMGDPARIGDYPDASDDYDLASTGLIKLLKERMNVGLDQAGALLDQPTHFTIGLCDVVDTVGPGAGGGAARQEDPYGCRLRADPTVFRRRQRPFVHRTTPHG